MEKVIIVRYCEIHLKGKNRGYFEQVFMNNLEKALSGIRHEIRRPSGRYVVENFDESRTDEIADRLRKVFGVHSLSIGTKVKADMEEIFREILRIAPDSGSFKIQTNRADKHFPLDSMQISAALGGRLLENKPSLHVDVREPETVLHVDIRENGFALVYSSDIPGAGGLPVGCSGRGMLLLSGGIDSPAAAYLMAKRGMKLFAVHFASPPYTSDKARDKVIDLRDKLAPYTGHMKLLVVPFTDVQLAIHEHCPANFMITIMRRFMMRIACRLSEKYECGALITGESLGQVASQTVESMTCTGATATLPIFRPLVGLDKDEITAIAKHAGTFDISIRPYEDCCTVFLPKAPVIHPTLKAVERAEEGMDIEGLVSAAVEGTEIF